MNDSKIPAWVSIIVLPLINILFAFAFSAIIFLAVDVNPIEAAQTMINGAFGYQEGIGYTFYYATNFIFTGLAVAVAFSAGLFNIGGEGQAYIGGLGVGLVCLGLDHTLPFWALLPITMFASMAFGALWALIPAYLQAYRGSHIVITTIMFNFIASSLMVYLMVNVLNQKGQMAPVSRVFEDSAGLPGFHTIAGWFGYCFAESPMNLSFLIALLCCVLVWLLLWRTRWGYAIRAMGSSPSAAEYGGINRKRLIIIVMLISGALSGLLSLNEVQGYAQQLKLGFVAGYGFTGIAVCLIGRNHPFGIVLASILFGILYQGGAELSFDFPNIDREMIQVVQALVVLFSGALSLMLVKPTERLFVYLDEKKKSNNTSAAEA
ncbi:ABC transporter permease [Psychromonas sp. 14N.309.X.WAT.B.A12]|uniref:ABC transporter permease n=1 Tax=Psychromonas sp. 14N.309.X.WAT.B.A12 TaxID=2998322 RepID=UPI0025B1A57E|nr:ABC transporter permease [Psychromonas sp. 14N.309.X.WAT.B.A12]MDN2663462.1 ABC transporter permease [Psychromonas sp. 14N.309.X.WAT.B.A12]